MIEKYVKKLEENNKEQQKEIERLNSIINEFKNWLESKKQFYDTDEEEAIDYYFLYGDVLNEFKGLLGELKGSDKE